MLYCRLCDINVAANGLMNKAKRTDPRADLCRTRYDTPLTLIFIYEKQHSDVGTIQRKPLNAKYMIQPIKQYNYQGL